MDIPHPQTRRERLQEATRAEIKQIARDLMAEEGTAALSLRAIARRMGMTAPGLYRYYPGLNDLLAALMVDAYNALGDTIEAARAACPPEAYAAQFLAVAHAYRAWALAHPSDFLLIFANPIPGFQPPQELIGPAAERTFSPFWGILRAAWQAGTLVVPPAPPAVPAQHELYLQMGDWMQQQHLDLPPHVVQALLGGWGKMQGLVMLEMFGHLCWLLREPRLLFEEEMRVGIAAMGLR